MEINTEINKIFGEEMAKLFADQISEEELRQEALNSYNLLRKRDTSYYSSHDSEFDKFLKNAILARFEEEVKKLLETEQVQIDIQEDAKKLVEEIRESARNKIVAHASDAIVNIYRGQDLSLILETAFYQASRGHN